MPTDSPDRIPFPDQEPEAKLDPVETDPANPTSGDADTTIVKADSLRLRPKKTLAVLVFMNGPEIGTHYSLSRVRCTIGRTSSADITIRSDALVSRFHAQIEQVFDPETHRLNYTLTDLGSTNHSFVNGHPVGHIVLDDGDQIQIGETTIRFSILDEMEARFHQEIHDRLRIDTLTGLLTKESFDLAAAFELERCAKRQLPLSVLMMDIDFFRRVNDRHGHQGGSWILSKLGSLLQENLRGCDLLGRFGGEEFVAALPEESTDQATAAAESIRTRLEATAFAWNDTEVRITISIGISQYPDHARDLKGLIAAADTALYECKHTGRNRVRLAAAPAAGSEPGARSEDDTGSDVDAETGKADAA